MNRLMPVLLPLLALNTACVVALKAPPAAPQAKALIASYGSQVMRFEEFQVRGVSERSLTMSVMFLKGRAAMDARTVRFTVERNGQPFTELSCAAAPDGLKASFGGISISQPKYTVSCTGPEFSFEMAGDAEKPLRGTVTWRGEVFPIKTVFETAEKGQSAHLGFVVEDRGGWLATSDIQGQTWVSTSLRPEAREAVVLANFAWASRRNVVLEGASGVLVLR